MTFFSKIGNFLTTNYNNGKIAQFASGLGKLGISAGFLSMALSNKSTSIFGDRSCCHCRGGYYPMMQTYYPMTSTLMGGGYFAPLSDPNLVALMKYNPMGILNSPYAQMYDDGTYSSYMSSMYNPMIQPYTPVEEETTALPKTNAKYAGDLDEGDYNSLGEALDKGLANLQKDGEPIKGKTVDLMYFGPDKNKYEEEYKDNVSLIASSWLADVDKNGTKDGKVTFEEYAKYEMKNLPENISDEMKQQAIELARNSFTKLDQNGDGKLDWKETAAMIRTFDRNTENLSTVDGKIQSEDFQYWSTKMAEAKPNEFDDAVRKDYKKLFGGE